MISFIYIIINSIILLILLLLLSLNNDKKYMSEIMEFKNYTLLSQINQTKDIISN